MKRIYDLEERTAKFGEEIIFFCRKLRFDCVNIPLIKQIIRSGTSIGANYCEANQASSAKDFKNKIFICKKEINETKHWIRMLEASNQSCKIELRSYYRECHELLLIFQKIINSLNKINKN